MITDKFQLELQNALTELQQNLQSLQSAKSQIEGAKGAAQNVLSGMDELRERYDRHLALIGEKLEAFLGAADNQYRSNVEESSENFRKISEEIEHLHQMSAQKNEQKISSIIREIEEVRNGYSDHLNQVSGQFSDFLEQSDGNFKKTLESSSNDLKAVAAEILSLHEQKSVEYKSLINEAVSDLHELREKYGEHLEKTDKGLSHLLENLSEQLNEMAISSSGNLKSHLNETKGEFAKLQEDLRNRSAEFKSYSVATLTELKNNQADHLEKVTEHSESRIRDLIAKTQASVKTAMDQMGNHLIQINEVYVRQNEGIDTYLKKIADLLNSVKDLENRVNKIDFPALFEELNEKGNKTFNNTRSIRDQISEMQTAIQSDLNSKTSQLAQQIQNQEKQLKWLKLIALGGLITIIILIFLVVR